MKKCFVQNVYDSVTGVLAEEYRVPDVVDLFADENSCAQLYGEMWEAYRRILERLGKEDEDKDVEVIINSLLSICEKVGIQMYHYGAKFGEQI